MALLTVFTPTYNRLHTITRTYESLCRQTCRDFDWLIIDDGSTDGTREWVSALPALQASPPALPRREGADNSTEGKSLHLHFDWMGRILSSEERKVKSEKCHSGEGYCDDHFFIETPNMRIEYIYKPNGGLYTGYNVAYQTIQTELCVCIDSDDFMPDDAVEKIVGKWSKLSEVEKKKYCGILGLDFDVKTGLAIGGMLPNNMEYCWHPELDSKDIHHGDMKQVMRTDLMKTVSPMIGFEGEKDFNPYYMLMKVLDKYPIIIINDNLCWVEYQIGSDSMSQGIWKQYIRSPQSYAKFRIAEMELQHTTPRRRFICAAHYVSSCIIYHKYKKITDINIKLFFTFMFAIPLGIFFTIFIVYKANKI